MAKPATFDGYSDQYTVDCERVLVTLLRGLGPWKESVFLVGGLTPRYLVPAWSAASTPWCASAASSRPRPGACSAFPSPTCRGF